MKTISASPRDVREFIREQDRGDGQEAFPPAGGVLAYRSFDGALVCKDGERVAGVVTFSLGEGVIVGIFVCPAFRRRGIGRTLLLAAIDRLRSVGLSHAEVEVCDMRMLALIEALPAEQSDFLKVVEAFEDN